MVSQEVYCVFAPAKGDHALCEGGLLGIYGSRKSAKEATKGYVKFFKECGRDVKTSHFKIKSRLMFD